jgi:hypothetical protein
MNFGRNVKFAAGQASPEDALSAANYPASGSFVDVSNFQWVNIVIHLGAVHNSDTPTFEVKQADAANGTADTLDTTYCKKECLGTDDDQVINFCINTDVLETDHHFLTVAVSGVTNGSYGDILFFLCEPKKRPVTQTTALAPSDNLFEKV